MCLRQFVRPFHIGNPEFDRTVIDAHTQKELADLGVYIEKCWYNVAEGNCSIQEMAAHIRTVGPERCFLSSDRGQGDRERPAQAMPEFISALLEHGITEEEMTEMVRHVPRKILALA